MRKICRICGKRFNVKVNNQFLCPNCRSKNKYNIDKKRNIKRSKLGTRATINLSPKAVSNQLYLIRNNIDKSYKSFKGDKSERDIFLERLVYDEDFSELYTQN